MKAAFDRFIEKVEKSSTCWYWKAQIYPNGYGGFSLYGKNMHAHRASWTLHNGEIPKGMCICHKCDNPCCVNPDHLFLGTYKDNTQDMIAKKRKFYPPRKLTEKEIDEAGERYLKGEKQRDIAKSFKIHQRTLWRHLHWKIPIKDQNGETNNNASLTQKQVDDIRLLYTQNYLRFLMLITQQ